MYHIQWLQINLINIYKIEFLISYIYYFVHFWKYNNNLYFIKLQQSTKYIQFLHIVDTQNKN